ncbi:MAG: HAMP domain-containing sensor histidine kinase, partial [Pseudoxanthomonas sp.]
MLRANATFCRWIGTQEDAIAGRLRFQDLLTVGGRIFHQTHWSPLLQMQGSISEVKLDIRHADGRALPMVMNAVRRGDPGQLRHELAVFAAGDRHTYEQELMRGRRQAEALLSEQQDRALFAEQMIGIVSHDLRSPLSAISLGTELLGRVEQDAQQTAIVQGLGRSARRARRLIDDLLDFTKARIGQGLPICVAPIDLHVVVANHVRELVPIYPDRALEHVTRGDGPVSADPDRVFQVISNLVANAVAYGASGAPITITSTAGPDASVSVHNAGDPIPAAL